MATLRVATTRHLLSRDLGSIHAKRNLFTKNTPPSRSPVRTGLYATVLALSAGLFTVYYFDARSALHRYFITPILRRALDAETGHKFAVKVLRSGLGPRDPLSDDERLRSQVLRGVFEIAHISRSIFPFVQIWGQTVSNPVGLAAGFDKDGEAVDGMFSFSLGSL